MCNSAEEGIGIIFSGRPRKIADNKQKSATIDSGWLSLKNDSSQQQQQQKKNDLLLGKISGCLCVEKERRREKKKKDDAFVFLLV